MSTLLGATEAQQLAVHIGWLMHRIQDGLIAGALFVLPGLVSIMAPSVVYALYGDAGEIDALFFGLKAAVLAIVLRAVMRIGSRAIRNRAMLGVAALSLVAIRAAPRPGSPNAATIAVSSSP